jgi:peptidoglycan/xylan/chitin deacetylase (PgdA/CDA1 family)
MVILTYHRLFREDRSESESNLSESFYAISEVVFGNNLKYLREQNFKTVLLEEFLDGSTEADQQSVILTFDDGQISDFEIALPLLVRYGFRAVFFICVEFIGKDGYMNWAEINALAAAGMSIQCHGLLHRDYSLLPQDEAMHELLAAKRCLQRNLGREIAYLALPGGFASASAYAAGLAAGFQAICNSEQAIASTERILKRFVLRRGTSQAEFEGLVDQDWKQLWASSIVRASTAALKSAIGGERYELVKQRLWR